MTFQYNTFHTKVVTLHCHQGDLCKAPRQGKVLCQISFKTFVLSREELIGGSLGGEIQKLEKMFRSKSRGSRSPSEFDGSATEGDSLR